ncbi:MAG: glycosyltransferase family 9 protein [Rhodospirillaceae bacterium]
MIKLSALGDFIQALGPCAAIRAHHPGADITLLTTRPYAPLAAQSPYFDQIWVDDRPRLWQVGRFLSLRQRLRAPRFNRVYDLQTSDRSGHYFRLMRRRDGGPEWSGIARGCSHPHANPQRDPMHTLDRQAEQLAMAGIPKTPFPDLTWVQADLSGLDLPPKPFALIVPGGAAHRPEKRWPAPLYGALAQRLVQEGWAPVVVGTHAEAEAAGHILEACPQAVSLIGKTDIPGLAALGQRAGLAVGNDTGPMHLLALVGCPSLVLYSHASDPERCGQRGAWVDILRVPDLRGLEEPDVWQRASTLLSSAAGDADEGRKTKLKESP